MKEERNKMKNTYDFEFPNSAESDISRRNMQMVLNIAKGIYAPIKYDDSLNINRQEILKNRESWRNISFNEKDTARYNPYLEENYNFMLAQDIYRASLDSMYSNPDFNSMSDEQFYDYVNIIKKDLTEKFKNSNIPVRTYAQFIEQFQYDADRAYEIFTDNKSRIIYENCLEKHAEDLAFKLNAVLFYLHEEKDKKVQIEEVLRAKTLECIDLGFPKDDIASKVLYNGLYNYLVNYSILLEAKTAADAFKDLKVKGFNIFKLIPDFENSINEMFLTAHNLYVENQQKIMQYNIICGYRNREAALKEFFKWYKSNRYSNVEIIDNVIITLMNKYNISDDMFFNFLLSSKSVLIDFQNSDIYTLCEIERKSLTGKLSLIDVADLLMNGFIGINDAIRYVENIEADIKPEVLIFEKSFNDEVLKSDKELLKERDIITIRLSEGEISLEEAQKQIKEIINK